MSSYIGWLYSAVHCHQRRERIHKVLENLHAWINPDSIGDLQVMLIDAEKLWSQSCAHDVAPNTHLCCQSQSGHSTLAVYCSVCIIAQIALSIHIC